ncbi:hypothetical protein K435DRAFT_289896 [Dendrothele bispora CBS 962.96]|uniref:Uncharacterized protein n=1 Tax=Dendrothele bispora (strain CBS 962.96) TaxID=1314807 RepID=A0A4S8LL17_DENBC|nr:hypothetical protein K435DRAFT_289896 [Dendrothele bispora CBS 962.96]
MIQASQFNSWHIIDINRDGCIHVVLPQLRVRVSLKKGVTWCSYCCVRIPTDSNVTTTLSLFFFQPRSLPRKNATLLSTRVRRREWSSVFIKPPFFLYLGRACLSILPPSVFFGVVVQRTSDSRHSSVRSIHVYIHQPTTGSYLPSNPIHLYNNNKEKS